MLLLSLNPGPCKTWLVACQRSRAAMLVDPVVDHVPLYAQALAQRGLKLVRVLDTHTHADHVSAGTLLAQHERVPYAMHHSSPVRTVTERLREADTVTCGDVTLQVVHTPGHTKDSLALLGKDTLFTGDFLFLGEGGAGRTDLLGGDPGEHWDSLQKLSRLADDLTVLPGHDYRGNERGRLGDERRTNPRLQQRSRDDYVRWLGGLRLDPAAWMLDVLRANAAGRTDKAGLDIPAEGACCEVRGGDAPPVVPTVGAEVLLARLHQGPRPFLVLDVREPHEYVGELGHVPDARNISVKQLADRLAELDDARDCDLFVICLSGGRSARATDLLRKSGFARALNVAGGMKGWSAAGYPQQFGPARSGR